MAQLVSVSVLGTECHVFESHRPEFEFIERWLSGLKHWFAKPTYSLNYIMGSNPILSKSIRLIGFEPITFGSEGQHSIQLSYKRFCIKIYYQIKNDSSSKSFKYI